LRCAVAIAFCSLMIPTRAHTDTAASATVATSIATLKIRRLIRVT